MTRNARALGATFALAAVLPAAGGMAVADVTIEMVPVGNAGSIGELSGSGAGGFGPDRICGAVGYEYHIGRYEVTAGQYTEFLNAVAGIDTYGLYSTAMWSSSSGCRIERYAGSGTSGEPYQYRVAAEHADRPVNFVSWGDAARFANWLTNGQAAGAQGPGTTETGSYALDGAVSVAGLLAVSRIADADRVAGKEYYFIPSEDEWYKAAYYDPATSSYYDYPTSSNAVPGYVTHSGNLSGTGTPFAEGGIDPGNYATYDPHADEDGAGSPYLCTVAGEWENSHSPCGTFDQGGNVWEWNEAIIDPSRGLRGGSYYSSRHESLHASNRSCLNPTGESDGLGFRVSEVPEPGTMALLALGAVGVLGRRRRSGRSAARRRSVQG